MVGDIARKQRDREISAFPNLCGTNPPRRIRPCDLTNRPTQEIFGETFYPAQVISLYRPTQNQPIMKIKRMLPVFLALALLGACKSSTTVVENDVGIIQGKVALSDVLCNPIANASGATVQIQGTGFSATTASNGQWQINDVPAGIYNIIITKPGFDTDLIPEYQFSGAGTQFLEYGAIADVTVKDSVPILSILVAPQDSIYKWLDSTVEMYDTSGVGYGLKVLYTMYGQDSAISFGTSIADITHPSFSPGNVYSTTIARNQTLSLGDTIMYPYWQHNYPPPGDSMVITTTPSSCEGSHGIAVSRGFVLP
jgi:hypothetical protein